MDNIATAISEGPRRVEDTLVLWEPLLQKIDKFVELTARISEVSFTYFVSLACDEPSA
jgi:hypothetical protein